MSDADAETEATETEALKLKDEPALYKRWMAEGALADKDAERWANDAKTCVDRYALESRLEGSSTSYKTNYNLFWSNVETLKPAVYLNPPKPDVSRRFKDKDPDGRLASLSLERAGNFIIDRYGFHSVAKQVRDDVLIVGIGQARVFLENSFVNDELAYSYPCAKYVNYADFQFSPCRNWDECRWVRFKSYMSRDELKDRFGKAASNTKLTTGPKDWDDDRYGSRPPSYLKQAEVYELWHKYSKRVFWYSPGLADKFLDVQDDPLRLDNFWPCPKPLLATVSAKSMRPIPDFIFYKEQARDIDILTQRICALESMIMYAGVHNPAIPELARMSKRENVLIAASNWAMYQESGGFKGNTEILPIEEMAAVLVQLYQARDSKIQDVYQVTGISDVIRGQNNPMESATATQGKIQFATLRLQDRQGNIQAFVRDLLELELEVLSKHVPQEIIYEMAGVALLTPQEQQRWPNAYAIIADDLTQNFRIDIETDSTIANDEETRKKQGMEFLQATSTFMDKAALAVQQMPEMLPVAGEILTFSARLFKQGRSMEATIESWLDDEKAKIEQAKQNPQPPPPDPAMIKLQNDFQIQQGELNLKGQELQVKQQELQIKAQELQIKAQELALEREKMGIDAGLKMRELKGKEEAEMMKALAPAQNGDSNKQSQPPVVVNLGSPSAMRARFMTNELGEREALVTDEPMMP